jgi:hypothetical protein
VARASRETVRQALKKTRMANLTGEQYDWSYSRSSFVRKGVKISRSLLQNGA